MGVTIIDPGSMVPSASTRENALRSSKWGDDEIESDEQQQKSMEVVVMQLAENVTAKSHFIGPVFDAENMINEGQESGMMRASSCSPRYYST